MADKVVSAATRATETSPLTKQSTTSSLTSSHYDLEYNTDLNEPQLKADFIFRVYSLLSVQLLLTVAVAGWMCFTDIGKGVGMAMNTGGGGIIVFILTIALICMMQCYKDQYPVNLMIFFLLTFLLGSSVGYACVLVSSAKNLQNPGRLGIPEGAELVLLAASLTAVIFISLTIYVARSKQDFSFLGGFLFVGLLANIVLSIVGSLLGLSFIKLICCVFGILIFTGYILYDTDQIVNKVKIHHLDMGTALCGALELYLDIINLFFYILELLVRLSGDR
jgi:FtsH-binding integral membrane protein